MSILDCNRFSNTRYTLEEIKEKLEKLGVSENLINTSIEQQINSEVNICSVVLNKEETEIEKDINKIIKGNLPIQDNTKLSVDKFTNGEMYNKGLRFNKGKLRYDLVDPWAQEQLVKVFTKGAEKYEPNNWRKGMSWTSVIASLKRHLNAIELGEDFDIETNMLHAAHVMWNAHCLTAYYKIHPQGDDRQHQYLNRPKIGLDIDKVLADWIGAWTKKFGYPIPTNWNFSYNHKDHFESMTKEEMEDLYLNIPTKISSKDIPFEPHCYITSRRVPVELTQKWIQKNGFSCAPVYSLGWGESKVEVAKESGIDIFVDDCYNNFVELNKAGICTYLLTAPHNERYSVGHKRLNSLKDLI